LHYSLTHDEIIQYITAVTMARPKECKRKYSK